MNRQILTLMIISPVLIAGCVSNEKVEPPLDSDPRIGVEVNQVCFTRSIHSWSDVDNDRDAVIVQTTPKKYFKLNLTPGCDPQWAMSHMAIISRPGSPCLNRGDRVKTDGDAFAGYGAACSIKRINEWNPEALKQAGKEAGQ